MTKPKKKPKKLTTSQLKKKLDNVFSKYIRQKYADNDGYVLCYTCGIKKSYAEIQNGHFVSRSHLATRYLEENCRPQCVGCNIFAGGRVAVFATNLEREKKGIVQELYRKAQEITKYYPYEEKIKEYEEKLQKLSDNN